ncbi:F-box domain-containing protein [Favolaschia claudopus]|uniref:F-box domain-containing protein n=1 Tax=Favolaschia claudopus TaxID=2862362 RepID=A0AAW0AYF2_9AGAR
MIPALADERARLVELEMQILEAERALTALKLQESVVRERLNAYKYPVLNLPNEIITETFLNFVPEYPKCSPTAGPRSPMRLTHICRLWREIALATPRLWRAMSLSLRSPFSLHNLWLDRAGSLPLAIHIRELLSDYSESAPDIPELVPALLPYLPRCEYLQCRHQMRLSDFPIVESELPFLRHLDLHLYELPPRGIQLLDVPMLRSVVLDNCATDGIVLPWTQLTTLSMHDISLENCEDILRQASNLLECKLNLFADDEDFFIDPPITLTHLNSFQVVSDLYITNVLDSFILPALSRLQIVEGDLGDHPISTLTTFISRSGCKLQQLWITYANLDTARSYVAAFPSIEELNVLAGTVPNPKPFHLL